MFVALVLLLIVPNIECSFFKGCYFSHRDTKVSCIFSSRDQLRTTCHELQTASHVDRIDVETTDWSPWQFDLSTCLPSSATSIKLVADQIRRLTLDPARMSRVRTFMMSALSLRHLPPQLKELPSLETFLIRYTNLKQNDFDAIPTTIKALRMWYMPIRTVPCQFLRSLRNLTDLDIYHNFNFGTVDTSCFPQNLERLDLSSNDLREVDLIALSRLPKLKRLYLHSNPLVCSCDFFRQYVEMLELGNIEIEPTFTVYYKLKYITCGSGPLMTYPWNTKNVQTLKRHDRAHLNCLSL